MRLKIECKPVTTSIPYNYQHLMASSIHKWLGRNNKEHGQMALFSFSGFSGGETDKNGIRFSTPTHWSFSSLDNSLLARLVEGIQKDPSLFSALEISKIMIQEEPEFTQQMRFLAATPIILKKTLANGNTQFLTFADSETTEYLTANLQHKLDVYGKPEWKENLLIRFDQDYPNPKTKLIDIKGIKNKGSICPVIISGHPEALRFAWHVGAGSNNGMGFGFLN